jgi:hypothetical protein
MWMATKQATPFLEPECLAAILVPISEAINLPGFGTESGFVSVPWLHCAINSFRFLGFFLWFVLGPESLQEAPGGPGKAHGGS